MNTQKYAKVLFDAFETKDKKEFEVFFQNFMDLIKFQKKQSFLPQIYKEVQKHLELKKADMKTVLTLKDKSDFEKYQDRLEKLKDYFNLDDLKIEENKNIVGGFILQNKKHTVDHSFRTKLLKMYNNLIKK